LPLSLAPRGLSRGQAAEYIGVGVTKFDEMVADGRMPKPKRIDSRTVWDRIKLDEAFAALDDEAEQRNEWDDL
jgi:predicted DNA-binding transcriptional regulator AlpA